MEHPFGVSVLIPVFNWSARELLEALVQQANPTIPFEIIVLDDASTNKILVEQNRQLAEEIGAQYILLNENRGRAFARNHLAEHATFDKLLFIDVDSVPKYADFLIRYVAAGTQVEVVAGGTCYYDNPPEESSKMLRWVYGKKREERAWNLRQTEGFQKLSLNNFLISKSLFLSIRLNESLKEYGHEDTLFGLELEAGETSLSHIDNPVYHTGLDHDIEFLAKSELAVQNLFLLSQQHDAIQNLRLFSASSYLAKSAFGHFIYWAGKKMKQRLLDNLQSGDPNVTYLDILKVWLLIGKIQGKNPSLFS